MGLILTVLISFCFGCFVGISLTATYFSIKNDDLDLIKQTLLKDVSYLLNKINNESDKIILRRMRRRIKEELI